MSYSANDNQNYFVQSGRTTSRVLHTPGGECSISLGGYTPAELERMRQLREQANGKADVSAAAATNLTKENPTKPDAEGKLLQDTIASDTVGQDSVSSTNEQEKPQEDAVSITEATTTVLQPQPIAAKKKGVSSNAFASASTTNSFNVLTDRPTSRVTNPPGGKDNLWF
jgi:hypothetical protein